MSSLQEWLAQIVSKVVDWAWSWHRQAGDTAAPHRPPVCDLRPGAGVQQDDKANSPTSSPFEIRVWPDSAAGSCTYINLGGVARLPTTMTCDDLHGVQHLRGVHTNIVATLPFLPHLTNLEIKGYNIVSVRQQLSWQHCTMLTNLQCLSLTAVHFGDDLGLHAVAKLPFLTSLSITAANISFPLQQVSSVSVMSLQSLQIAQCCVFGNTGAELCSLLGALTSLTSLQLSHLVCRPCLQGLHHLSSVNTLQRLDLTGTRIGNDSVPDWLQRLTCLSVLTCTHSYIPASLLEAFKYRAQQPQGSKVCVHEPPRARTQDDIDSCQVMHFWEQAESDNASNAWDIEEDNEKERQEQARTRREDTGCSTMFDDDTESDDTIRPDPYDTDGPYDTDDDNNDVDDSDDDSQHNVYTGCSMS